MIVGADRSIEFACSMSRDEVDLCGLAISRLGLGDSIAEINKRVDLAGGGYGCFVNAHTLTEATKHDALRDALGGATFRFADGTPLLWLSRAKNRPIASRVCGPDVMTTVLEQRGDLIHGFLGGSPGCAERIATRFGIRSVSYSPPMRPFSRDAAREDWDQLLQRADTPPRLVWVGLGAPKQEQWMAAIAPSAPTTLFLGVGAAFDFLAGLKPRAPRVLQHIGLEWAYRLATEPRRLWKRYLTTNARFVGLAWNDVRSMQAE